MTKNTTKNLAFSLAFLCTTVYFISYLTRLNYSVVMLEIMNAQNITKAAASLVVTYNAIAYALGQPISGYLGDKVNPANIVLSGLLTTTAVNLLIPFTGENITLMTILWTINGLAQAMMWPPIVKILTSYLKNKEYKRSVTMVYWGSSLATVLLYLLAPLCISISGWELIFFISAGCSLLIALLFKPCLKKIVGNASVIKSETSEKTEETPAAAGFTGWILIVLATIMLLIVLQGFLREGITNFMPVFLAELFSLESEFAILSSVILPIFSIVCFQFASFVNLKLIKNELVCSAFFYGISFVCAIILAANPGKSVISAVLLCAGVTGAMHGVNLMLNTYVPAFFRKYGKVSLITGLLNASTYLGVAASTYIIALLSDSIGWAATIGTLAVISGVATVVSLLIAKKWTSIK